MGGGRVGARSVRSQKQKKASLAAGLCFGPFRGVDLAIRRPKPWNENSGSGSEIKWDRRAMQTWP